MQVLQFSSPCIWEDSADFGGNVVFEKSGGCRRARDVDLLMQAWSQASILDYNSE